VRGELDAYPPPPRGEGSGEGSSPLRVGSRRPLSQPVLRFAQARLPSPPWGERVFRALLAVQVLFLAACQTAPQGYVLLHANQNPVNAAKHIADMVGDCWFGDGNSYFADYSYAPELSSSERPRVLIVEKSDPAGLPKLVIEVVREKRGSDIRLFGPLMENDQAERIRDDVAFWAGGGRICR